MHQTKAWHAMRGFFHFNPLQACLNKVQRKKTRTAKASGFGLYSEKTFFGSWSNPVLLIKFSQHRFFNPEAQVDIYISGIPAECP
jgi:hypothetical protein